MRSEKRKSIRVGRKRHEAFVLFCSFKGHVSISMYNSLLYDEYPLTPAQWSKIKAAGDAAFGVEAGHGH